MILGACYSSLAPAAWAKHKLKVPVSHLLCTSEEPFAKDVVDFIAEVLRLDALEQSAFSEDGELTYLDEGLFTLMGNMPSRLKVRLFLRGTQKDKYEFAEVQKPGDPAFVEQALLTRVASRQMEALARAVRQGAHLPVPTTAELASNHSKQKRSNRNTVGDADDRARIKPPTIRGRGTDP